MKKLLIMTGVLALTMLTSCKEDRKEPVPPATPPPVEDPAPEPTPQPQANNTSNTTTTTTTVTTKTEDPDGTSVSIGSDGMSVKNKNGDNKSNVTISRKNSQVEFNSEN